jgi:hypothetical protein
LGVGGGRRGDHSHRRIQTRRRTLLRGALWLT